MWLRHDRHRRRSFVGPPIALFPAASLPRTPEVSPYFLVALAQNLSVPNGPPFPHLVKLAFEFWCDPRSLASLADGWALLALALADEGKRPTFARIAVDVRVPARQTEREGGECEERAAALRPMFLPFEDGGMRVELRVYSVSSSTDSCCKSCCIPKLRSASETLATVEEDNTVIHSSMPTMTNKDTRLRYCNDRRRDQAKGSSGERAVAARVGEQIQSSRRRVSRGARDAFAGGGELRAV
ncbi:hypothetical protein C8Q76DRAFT_132963 [Earliella scabrosa]|nr:hypothetical protein C8Q76DRAFT_132963 [Earliella scabrosa]